MTSSEALLMLRSGNMWRSLIHGRVSRTQNILIRTLVSVQFNAHILLTWECSTFTLEPDIESVWYCLDEADCFDASHYPSLFAQAWQFAAHCGVHAAAALYVASSLAARTGPQVNQQHPTNRLHCTHLRGVSVGSQDEFNNLCFASLMLSISKFLGLSWCHVHLLGYLVFCVDVQLVTD